MSKHSLIILLTIFCFYYSAHAQLTMERQAISSGGNLLKSGDYELSHTLGEFYSQSTVSGAIYLNAGFQQGYPEDLLITSVKDFKISSLPAITVFPNPTADNFTLQISELKNAKLVYQLYDMQGKLLSNEQIGAPQTLINMNGFPSAIYFMHVINQDNHKIHSFKIIKTQ